MNLSQALTYENASLIGESVFSGSVPEYFNTSISIQNVDEATLKKSKDWIQLLRRDEVLDEIESFAAKRLTTGSKIFY